VDSTLFARKIKFNPFNIHFNQSFTKFSLIEGLESTKNMRTLDISYVLEIMNIKE